MSYGFLRETEDIAKAAGINKNTGLHRTGLDTYLKVIFPTVTDWVHDKQFPKEIKDSYSKLGRKRPDYRSEQLKMIIEVDGLPHYQNPSRIIQDINTNQIYVEAGYNVVRIPYFIQLTNSVVKSLFDVEVSEQLFPEGIASLESGCYPAYLCPLGIKRMAIDLVTIDEGQLITNLKAMYTDYLNSDRNDTLIGFKLLSEEIYNLTHISYYKYFLENYPDGVEDDNKIIQTVTI